MSGTVIVGSGGGHASINHMDRLKSRMTHEQLCKAEQLLARFNEDCEALIADVESNED